MASSFSSPWPDSNSPVLSKVDFGVPLVELFKWLDVRDTLLGANFKKQDIIAALALARDCKHPDAEWLISIFEGKEVSTKEQALEGFLLYQDDARALCFVWHLTDDRRKNFPLLRRSSEMGNAFACSTLCAQFGEEDEEEAFRLAQLAVARCERDGFLEFGRFLSAGFGCEENLDTAKENLLIAAELGHGDAAHCYGRLLGESDPAHWIWWGRAALRFIPGSFLDAFSTQVELFFSGSGNATIVCLIGRALKGNIDMEKKRIFGWSFNFDSYIGPANQAVSFYDSQIKSARLAVDTWTFVSTRLHLIKDLRIFIGKMIWEARFEANFKIENDTASRVSHDQKRFRK